TDLRGCGQSQHPYLTRLDPSALGRGPRAQRSVSAAHSGTVETPRPLDGHPSFAFSAAGFRLAPAQFVPCSSTVQVDSGGILLARVRAGIEARKGPAFRRYRV